VKAADQGDALAQGHVGRIYRTGFFNGRADFGNALKYYREAAAKNVAVAQLGLGSMYKAGEACRRARPRRWRGSARPPRRAMPWRR